MTLANKEFRNKIYKTNGDSYVSINDLGEVGYEWKLIDPTELSWEYGVHNHWIDKNGNLKLKSINCLVLDWGVPEDLENV